MGEHQNGKKYDWRVLAGCRKSDRRSDGDRIAEGPTLRNAKKRPRRDEHEEKREKIGVADVLGCLNVERIQRDQSTCGEAALGPKQCQAELERERNRLDPDQHAETSCYQEQRVPVGFDVSGEGHGSRAGMADREPPPVCELNREGKVDAET